MSSRTVLLSLLTLAACKKPEAAPAPAAAPAATAITWRDSATRFRGQAGATLTFVCPPGGTPSTVWGTDTYSDDSSICTAAAHSGRITRAQGGTVSIQIAPGQPSYAGSLRGGESSQNFGSFPGSFTIVGGPRPGLIAVPVPRVTGNGVNIGGVQITVGGGGAATPWSARATPHRGQNGTSFTQVCPPGGAFATVWGTDVYTDDSSICTAAVHAGRITREQGGTVTVFVHPGRARYPGVARNGVTTSTFGSFPGSFAFTPVVAPEVSGPPGVEAITWTTTATRFRAQPGERQQVWCPPGGSPATVWGDGPFTDDSSICTAAVFEGRITLAAGGVVRLRAAPGRSRYHGDTHNGITTRDFGSFPGSFEVTR